MYTQVRETAMGTKFAPTYATLVLAYLEEKLYSKIEIKFGKEFAVYIKVNWKRFSDDCFVFWIKGEKSLKTFHSILNELHPYVTFTLEYSEEKLTFLDVFLLQFNNRIIPDIYTKETDSKQYLNFHSYHPKHTKISIPYNLVRRICTIVSDQNIQKTLLSELRKHNYPDTVISEGISKATSVPRNLLLTPSVKKRKKYFHMFQHLIQKIKKCLEF